MANTSLQYLANSPWQGLVSVSPQLIKKQCHANQQEFLTLTVRNETEGVIAWKLKTNRPGRYMVSPKHGIIAGQTAQECTVVVSAMQQAPDMKKADKFLIQATKVATSETDTTLPDLWRERESKHNKKEQRYAYEAITVKCYLSLASEPSLSTVTEGDKGNETISAATDTLPLPSVSSVSCGTPGNGVAPSDAEREEKSSPGRSLKPSQASPLMRTPDTPEDGSVLNASETNTVRIIEDYAQQSAPTSSASMTGAAAAASAASATAASTTTTVLNGGGHGWNGHSAEDVKRWKEKAAEYDEMLSFSKKILAQRAESEARYRSSEQKIKVAEKQIKELKEEKKQLLARLKQQDGEKPAIQREPGEMGNDDNVEANPFAMLDKIDERKDASSGIDFNFRNALVWFIIVILSYNVGRMVGCASVVCDEANIAVSGNSTDSAIDGALPADDVATGNEEL